VGVASWIWELSRWMRRKQKNAANQYNKRVVTLITTAQQVETEAALMEIWLLATLAKAVHDLDTDKMSQESFNSFRSILQIGLEVTKEHRAILDPTSGETNTATGPATHLMPDSANGSPSPFPRTT
jgi:hypothetical protein